MDRRGPSRKPDELSGTLTDGMGSHTPHVCEVGSPLKHSVVGLPRGFHGITMCGFGIPTANELGKQPS